jgi:hypothetical protein
VVQQVIDGQLLCSFGHMLCAAGTWGACESERVVTRSMSQLHIQSFDEAGSPDVE